MAEHIAAPHVPSTRFSPFLDDTYVGNQNIRAVYVCYDYMIWELFLGFILMCLFCHFPLCKRN